MSTTVSAFITDLLSKYEHVYTNADILSFVNEVELNVYADIAKIYTNQYYRRQLNVSQFSLPSGVSFDDVRNVYVGGIPYRKYDVRSYKQNKSYWYENSKLNIYSLFDTTDTEYVSGASEITFASSTITTTGDDFVGFVIGDVIQVTGCLLTTGNNKFATVLGVAAKVLTFATGTFTAQIEAAVISMQTTKIKVTYQVQPVKKLIADIATDTLLISDRFMDVYTYYCVSKIALFNRDFGEYKNWQLMYNNRVGEYKVWRDSIEPIEPESNVIADSPYLANRYKDFDTEQYWR